MAESCLYRGTVIHHRLRPFAHRFGYRVYSLFVDLEELPRLQSRWFRHNRFAPLSLHDRDHGPRDGGALRPWVVGHLRARGIEIGAGRVFLHCFPRVLGHGFDPISLYWCHDETGAVRAVLVEVKNTFGDQHGYLIPVAEARAPGAAVRGDADKVFHVSPFMDLAMRYRFRLDEPGARMRSVITQDAGAGTVLVAIHGGTRVALTPANLAKMFFTIPLVSLKIVAAIHWQALRLWLKGARIRPYRPPPSREVS